MCFKRVIEADHANMPAVLPFVKTRRCGGDGGGVEEGSEVKDMRLAKGRSGGMGKLLSGASEA